MTLEQYEREQDRLEAQHDALEIQWEQEAEDAFWDKLTKEGRIKGPDW